MSYIDFSESNEFFGRNFNQSWLFFVWYNEYLKLEDPRSLSRSPGIICNIKKKTFFIFNSQNEKKDKMNNKYKKLN